MGLRLVVVSKASTVLIRLKAKIAAACLSTVCATTNVASAAADPHLSLEEGPLQGLSLRLLLRLQGLWVEVLLQLGCHWGSC